MSTPITVLVVEDEPLLRMDVVDDLSDRGFTVLEAANADEAIRIIESTPGIQAVFTDIDMPGSMDGLKLAAAVRDRWPPVKILVASGHRRVDPSDLPDDTPFFPKPYASGKIAQAIIDLVG